MACSAAWPPTTRRTALGARGTATRARRGHRARAVHPAWEPGLPHARRPVVRNEDAHVGRMSMWRGEAIRETLPGGHVRGLAAVRALITEQLRDAPPRPA